MGKFFPKSKILLMLLVIVAANAASVLYATNAFAFGTVNTRQLAARAIRLGDSSPSAVTNYLVTFKIGFTTGYTVKGIIVDFCSNSPVVGSSTCTAPTGFSIPASPTVQTTPNTTPGLPGADGVTDLTGAWTSTGINTNRTLKMTLAAGVALTSANTYGFNVAGITNPSTTGTFYARIITYTNQGAGSDINSYAPGTEGSVDMQDYGGVALSTANFITLTARVPEQLQFCVSGVTMTAGCTGMTTPTLTLGHGTVPAQILDASAVDTVNAFTQVSTNATSGVVIRMRNLNTCTTGAGGLFRTGAGTTCDIPAVNSGGSTAAAIVAGTAAFGMNEPSGTLAAGFTAPAPYTGTSGNYGMDATTSNANVSSTYGSTIATSAAPSANSTTQLTFAATASATTPAGSYTATIVLVCTGMF